MHCLQCSKTPRATGHRTGTAPTADPGKQKQATRPMVDASVTTVDASVILPSQTPAPIPDPLRFTPRKAKDTPRRNNTTAQNEASAPTPVVEEAKKSLGKEIAKEGVHFGIYDGKLAKEHANWVDTSEEELHNDTDFEDLLMESDDNNIDDGNVDEDDDIQDLNHPHDPVSSDLPQNPPVVATNGPTSATDATLNNIEDLTPTQVLFGHGSFGGIVLSQPTEEGNLGLQSTTGPPLQSRASAKGTKGTFVDDEMAIPLESPSPQQFKKTGMDLRHSGPCTPENQKGKQIVGDTPQSSPLHQRCTSHSPGTTQADRLVPRGPEVVRMSQLFAQYNGCLPCLNIKRPPREHILASQEFSQSYSKRSQFSDLIEAVTYENSQSPSLQTILSYVDDKIQHAIQSAKPSKGT
ncbi:unnamed protein product [Calypogeia fissa]